MQSQPGMKEEIWICVIVVLSALLLGSHQLLPYAEFQFGFHYLYWLVRFAMEAGIFFAILLAVEKYAVVLRSGWLKALAAILISLIPYALTITSFDLVVGLPELGIQDNATTGTPLLAAFGQELIYLLDNHLAFCALLLLPRVWLANQTTPQPIADSTPTTDIPANVDFIAALDPPLQGTVYSIEAQEHYVKVVTSEESRMVLFRFSDVIRQFPASAGMQVHRSHWVAHHAVARTLVSGQSLKLELINGNTVPVSRTFRTAVSTQYDSTASAAASAAK